MEVTRMASNATHYNNLTPAQPLDKKTLNKMVWPWCMIQKLHRQLSPPKGDTIMVERFARFSLAISEISRCWHKLAAEEMAPLRP